MRRVVALFILALAGCDRNGVTHASLKVDCGFIHRAYPIEIDPDLVANGAVQVNEHHYVNGGMDVEQNIVIMGPIRIVRGRDPDLPPTKPSTAPEPQKPIGSQP